MSGAENLYIIIVNYSIVQYIEELTWVAVNRGRLLTAGHKLVIGRFKMTAYFSKSFHMN